MSRFRRILSTVHTPQVDVSPQIANFVPGAQAIAIRSVRPDLLLRDYALRVGFRDAQPDKFNLWLGREIHQPVQIATETPDLSSELRRGLTYVRGRGKRRK